MVKDDSLYILAIVAVVAVVGLVIMATGTSTVVEELPDMVQDDSSAIAGQAVSYTGGRSFRYKSPAISVTGVKVDESNTDSSVALKVDELNPDSDGDGVRRSDDCNDRDASVQFEQDYFFDYDGDGWGDVAVTRTDCQVPSNYTDNPGDCDDTDEYVYPGATEVCDGVDNDCDGSIDEGVQTWFFADADSDGYRAGSEDRQRLCTATGTYQLDSGAEADCDDSDASVGSASICYSAVDGNGTIVTIGPYCPDDTPSSWYTSVVEVSC